MSHLAAAVRTFTPVLKPHPENADALELWTARVRAPDLPYLHASPAASSERP